MYRAVSDDEMGGLVQLSCDVLGIPSACGAAMNRVITEWPISSLVNLTDRTCNRRAWLGRASCMIASSSPDEATRLAWWKLSGEQQNEANRIADEVISAWENSYA